MPINIYYCHKEYSVLLITLSSKNPLDVLSVIFPGRVFSMPFNVVCPTQRLALKVERNKINNHT